MTKLFKGDILNGGLTIKEVLDTNSRHIRVRSQMKDVGSYDVAEKVKKLKIKVSNILNPDSAYIEKCYKELSYSKNYLDSIFKRVPAIKASVIDEIADGDIDMTNELYEKPELLLTKMEAVGFHPVLRNAIEKEYFKVIFTGTSVVAAEGTKYLVKNLITSLIFAILSIAILMAILFRSWRMVVISMIPNMIPLLFTAGIMGWFGIPLKPSTLLVFSIAFGISVDDTIHNLAKYRQE